MDRARLLNVGAVASAGVALIGAVGVFFAEGPYLSVSKGIEAWLGVYALVESDWLSFRSGWLALPEN